MWEIKSVSTRGINEYNYARVPNHPKADKYGNVLEHRIVMENHIGRLLMEDECIHHINGNKKDNRIENLELMKKKEHNSFHSSNRGRRMLKIKCPGCGTIFVREYRKSHIARNGIYTSCSYHCSRKFSRMIQIFGYNKEVKRRLKENILEEFRKWGT